MNNNASPNTSLDGSSSEAAALAELQARNRLLEAEVARLRAHQEAIAHGISHDLRGPLRAIDGFAAQIERAGGPPSETGGSPRASRIRAAAARMGDLIDSLLEYLQVGRRELVRVPIDIDFLAHVTEGNSGADIKEICNQAGLNAFKRESGTKKRSHKVTYDDLEMALAEFANRERRYGGR